MPPRRWDIMVRGDQTLRCEVYPYPLVSSLFARKATGYSAPRWGGALQREAGWDILSPIDEISCLKVTRHYGARRPDTTVRGDQTLRCEATRHYGARRPDTTVRGDQTLRCEVYPYPLVSSLFARKEKTSPIYISYMGFSPGWGCSVAAPPPPVHPWLCRRAAAQ